MRLRINKSVFKFIENELYNFEDTKKELQRYREEILDSSPYQEVSVQSGIGDTTLNKAIRLTSSAYVIQTERTIKAIDKSLAILGEDHRKLYRLKYKDCLPWQEVMIDMCISDRTFFRWRRELVSMVGQQLGIVNIE